MKERFKRASRQNVRNPWGLTLRQVDMMDELCRVGTVESAGIKLGLTLNTAESYMRIAKRKMGFHGVGAQVLAVLAFDRWRQGEGKGVPA